MRKPFKQLPIVGVRGRNPLSFINFQPGVTLGGEFRLEMTNATNTPQWEFMDSSIITSPLFGRETSPNNSARRIQLGLKYHF